MYSINMFRHVAQQQRAPGHQQRQQQQQHPPHPHRLLSQKPISQTLCRALTPSSASRLSRNPARTRQQHTCRLCVAASASKQPTSPTQKQQQQQSGKQQQQQQQQQQDSSKPSPNEADDGWDSEDEYEDDEYEYLDEGDEGWEDEDEWEDEEAEADEPLAPAVRQIPQEQTAVDFTQEDFVEVGLISRPHGVRGEVKVQLITDEPKKRLGTAGKRLWLQPLPVRSGLVPPAAAAARQAGGSDSFKQLRRVVVQSGRVARPGARGQREEWAVKFEGINSREQAATLAGFKLLLALCDREARPRSRDEFFIDQLVGLKVVDEASSILIGIVTEVYESGSSYSLLRMRLAPEESDIQASKYRSVLVPFVSEIVPSVDVAGGQLGVSLPEGLLETASSTKLRKAYTPEQQAQLREQLKRRQEQQKVWQQQQQQTS